MSELLKQISLEALVNTGFKERYIELKKDSKLTDEVFKVLSSHAMRKLVKIVLRFLIFPPNVYTL